MKKTRKKIKSNYLLIIAISTCLSTSLSFAQIRPIAHVELKLRFMAYACGDCYPQYHVIKIIKSDIDRGKLKWLSDTDIEVMFNQSALDSIESSRLTCSTCFTYQVEGDLYKENNKIYVVAADYSMRENRRGCCDRLTKKLLEGRKRYPNNE